VPNGAAYAADPADVRKGSVLSAVGAWMLWFRCTNEASTSTEV